MPENQKLYRRNSEQNRKEDRTRYNSRTTHYSHKRRKATNQNSSTVLPQEHQIDKLEATTYSYRDHR
eukprot:3281748-Amphidinium_carterae.1